MTALRAFVSERFSPTITIPMSLIIAAALADPAHATLYVVLETTLYTWLVLLLARGIDDLTSLDEDRLRHGHRGLVTGAIKPAVLSLWLGAAAMGVLSLSPNLSTLALSTAGTVFLGLAFSLRHRLAARLWPMVSNAVFLMPGFWCLLAPDRGGPATLPIALTLWLGSAAHHWLHTEDPASAGVDLWLGLVLSTAGTVVIITALIVAPAIALAPLMAAVACYAMTVALAWPLHPAYAGRSQLLYIWGYCAFLFPLALWCLARGPARIML